MLFEGFCIFGYREFYKNLLCILIEVNKTIYGNNGDFPDKLLDIFLLSCPRIRNHMNRRVVAPDPVFPQSYQTIINNQEFIIHNSVTRPAQYSLYTLPTMSTRGLHGYSWFNGLLRNPRSGVQTPQVLGYSPIRAALILGQAFKTPTRGWGPTGYTGKVCAGAYRAPRAYD